MHAVIKIVSFLVFGAAVSMGNGQVLLAGALLVAPLYLFDGKVHLHGAFVMLKRLKWLFISILIVYLFFTPGQLLWPDVYWGPTVEGLMQGALRIAVLMLLVSAVNLLISSTEQEAFLSGILWCLQPLSLFGLPHERLAVRISLTLDAVSHIRSDLQSDAGHDSHERDAVDTPAVAHTEPKLMAISMKATHLFQSVIINAESALVREISLPEESRPPIHQWLIPVGLAALFAVIKYLVLNERF